MKFFTGELLDLLVPVLAFLSVLMTGGAIVSVYSAERRAVRRRLREIGGPSPAEERPQAAVAGFLGRLGAMFSRRGPSPGLRQQLADAGYPGHSAPAVYLGAKQLLLLIGLGGSTALLSLMGLTMQVRVMLTLLGGVGLFFVPNIVVAVHRRRRTLEVAHHLPDAIDLLEICVGAGMGLDMAWNSVAQEIRKVSTILADEMALTNLEMHLGAPRRLALRHMAQRTGVSTLSSLVAMLAQSDRFGTSISDTLRAFAETLREDRSLKAQETAEKMAVKLLVPMVLFIFPAVLIVLVGPSLVRLWRAMGTY